MQASCPTTTTVTTTLIRASSRTSPAKPAGVRGFQLGFPTPCSPILMEQDCGPGTGTVAAPSPFVQPLCLPCLKHTESGLPCQPAAEVASHPCLPEGADQQGARTGTLGGDWGSRAPPQGSACKG